MIVELLTRHRAELDLLGALLDSELGKALAFDDDRQAGLLAKAVGSLDEAQDALQAARRSVAHAMRSGA